MQKGELAIVAFLKIEQAFSKTKIESIHDLTVKRRTAHTPIHGNEMKAKVS